MSPSRRTARASRLSPGAFPSEFGSLPVERGKVNEVRHCRFWTCQTLRWDGIGYNHSPVPPTLLRKLRRIFMGFVAAVLLLLGAAFVVDFAVFRIRVAAGWQPYGSVVVHHYYAVAQKANKVQFIFDPPQPWPCTRSVFPHGGNWPCWYLKGHPEQRTDL